MATQPRAMEQLPLEISPPREARFEDFIPGANAEALACVRALAEGALRESIVYLWGEPGCGRTHLLDAARRIAPGMVIADDVERLERPEQQALFVAINAARDGGPPVLAAGGLPPARLALREDLRTRLAWGLVYELKPLGDEDKADHLRRESARRGLRLPEDVLRYLLTHLPRDLGSLGQVLDALDRQSLARQRPITLSLVRDALAGRDAAARD